LFVSGWSMRLYVGFVQDAVRTKLDEKTKETSDKVEAYLFVVKGKVALGHPDAPDIHAEELVKQDLVTKAPAERPARRSISRARPGDRREEGPGLRRRRRRCRDQHDLLTADAAILSAPSMTATIDQLLKVLKEVIEPVVRADGGEVYVVAVEPNHLSLHLAGRYAGCPGAPLVVRG
jgi:hypothetical protein